MHLSQKRLEIELNGRNLGITNNVNDDSIAFLNISKISKIWENFKNHKFALSPKRLELINLVERNRAIFQNLKNYSVNYLFENVIFLLSQKLHEMEQLVHI